MKNLLITFIISCLSLMAISQKKEGYSQNKGVKIFYRTFGKGIPILIINGGPGMNSDGFTDLAEKLSGNNMTILFDQRGTGRSALAKTDQSTITMDLMIADMEALRKHLDIDKWIILGHSFGGMLASYYTTLYPSKVEKLILSSSGGIDLELTSYATKNINSKLSLQELESLKYWNQQISAGDTSYHARLERGMALAPAYVYNRKFIPVIAERLTQGNSAINSLVWNDLQKIGFNCKEKLASFSEPVLIIQGKQDVIEERTGLKALHAFKNAKMILMDNCVHYGWLDSEAEYFAAIGKFLKQ